MTISQQAPPQAAVAVALDARTTLSRQALLSAAAALAASLSLWASGALAQEAEDGQAQAMDGVPQVQPSGGDTRDN